MFVLGLRLSGRLTNKVFGACVVVVLLLNLSVMSLIGRIMDRQKIKPEVEGVRSHFLTFGYMKIFLFVISVPKFYANQYSMSTFCQKAMSAFCQ